MRTYQISSEQNVTSMLHVELYNASCVHYFNWISAKQEQLIYDFASISESEFERFRNADSQAKASRWGMIAFAAFTLEAFINFYAEMNKMDDRRELERKLSTRKKWRSYPTRIAGHNIDETVHEYIDDIFNLRDRLVHHKPITGSNNITSFFIPANGRKLLNKVHYCVRSLDNLKAPFISSTWISEDFADATDWVDSVTF